MVLDAFNHIKITFISFLHDIVLFFVNRTRIFEKINNSQSKKLQAGELNVSLQYGPVTDLIRLLERGTVNH